MVCIQAGLGPGSTALQSDAGHNAYIYTYFKPILAHFRKINDL